MLNLTIKILELSEKQEEQLEEGIEVNLKDCIVSEVTLYRVDYIRPLNGGKYCLIASGGDVFTSYECFDTIKAKMQERLTFLSN